MTATDELRLLLREGGVSYCKFDKATTWEGINGSKATSYAVLPVNEKTKKLLVKIVGLTPEQIVEATLGRGTCEWILEHSGTLYDKWRCSKCGYLYVSSRCDAGATDLVPNYCPNCGLEVVS